jgi:hypothetical protein
MLGGRPPPMVPPQGSRRPQVCRGIKSARRACSMGGRCRERWHGHGETGSGPEQIDGWMGSRSAGQHGDSGRAQATRHVAGRRHEQLLRVGSVGGGVVTGARERETGMRGSR